MKMRRERKRAGIGRLLLLFLICAALFSPGYDRQLGTGHSLLSAASAEEGWRQEFEEVCSKTQDAMALSVDELTSLIARCDALKSRIEKLEESTRKVYLKRLQVCRDLYAFVLDSKRQK